MPRKGFLLVLMHPPSTFEEEFNAWYDAEHVPERMSVPGFETAIRYVSTGPAPRYMAMYDLARFDVLASDAYQRVGGANASPWTKRVTARARVYRSAGEQIYPGSAPTPIAARVGLLRFRGVETTAIDGIVTGLRGVFEDRQRDPALRVFAYKVGHGTDVLAFVAGVAPFSSFSVEAVGEASRTLDLMNEYVPMPPP